MDLLILTQTSALGTRNLSSHPQMLRAAETLLQTLWSRTSDPSFVLALSAPELQLSLFGPEVTATYGYLCHLDKFGRL